MVRDNQLARSSLWMTTFYQQSLQIGLARRGSIKTQSTSVKWATVESWSWCDAFESKLVWKVLINLASQGLKYLNSRWIRFCKIVSDSVIRLTQLSRVRNWGQAFGMTQRCSVSAAWLSKSSTSLWADPRDTTGSVALGVQSVYRYPLR